MGNIRSITNALSYLGVDSCVIDSPGQILESERLILPGVGSFRAAMENIKTMGFFDALNEAVLKNGVLILGICLGMQLLLETGEEDGLTSGFGWMPGIVKRFSPSLALKVPHIGFNTVYFKNNGENLFKGLGECSDFYFVHSYRVLCREPEKYVSSWADYGEKFAASLQYKNIFGTQFHPEKSQSNGLVILKNFSNL